VSRPWDAGLRETRLRPGAGPRRSGSRPADRAADAALTLTADLSGGATSAAQDTTRQAGGCARGGWQASLLLPAITGGCRVGRHLLPLAADECCYRSWRGVLCAEAVRRGVGGRGGLSGELRSAVKHGHAGECAWCAQRRAEQAQPESGLAGHSRWTLLVLNTSRDGLSVLDTPHQWYDSRSESGRPRATR